MPKMEAHLSTTTLAIAVSLLSINDTSDTWLLYLIWIGILCVLCCVSYVVLFFSVMVQFSVLLYSFSVLLYSSDLLYCSLLFILLCSS